MKRYPLTGATLLVALALALPVATFADAPTASTAMATPTPVPGTSLINVSRCHPKLNNNYDSGYPPAAWSGASQVYNYYDVYGGYPNQRPSSSTANLFIDYTNTTHKVMTSVEFGLTTSGVVIAEVKDSGKFAPGAEIKHRFSMGNGVVPLTNQPPVCMPLRITWADGTTWKAPHLPAINKSATYGSGH